MNKKLLVLIVCSTAIVPHVSGQPRAKGVKQPREVIEAYRVCEEFRQTLAENFDFDRAFEATFVKDPARRREIALAEAVHGTVDLSPVDTATIVDIYKQHMQLFVLMVPLVFVARDEDAETELLTPEIAALFQRKPPNDPQQLPAFTAQRKRDIVTLRAYVEKIASTNPSVAENIQAMRQHLLTPLERPNRIVKPLTTYSRGKVLRVDEKYYQIDDCAVVREGAQMKLIGYVLLRFRG